MKQQYLGLSLALLFAVAAAGPINSELFKDSRTCAKRCIDNHKFDYNVKSVYEYKYEADSKTSIVGASEDAATIRIMATVEMEPTSHCDFEMRLKDVSLVDPYQTQDMKVSPDEFGRILAKWPLRFSFQDGRIEDLCPRAEDPSWALNIKRGILSAFQNSMKKFNLDQNIVETDVTGSCETKYTQAKDGSVTKTKDMVSCKHRQGVHSAVQSIGYDAKSQIQNLAIVKTSYSCTQQINKKHTILQESKCVEKHIFRPFSNGDSGAATVNTQKLTFSKVMRGGSAKQEEIKMRTDLHFTHLYGESHSANAGERIEMKLVELCQITKEDVRPEQPELFSALVKAMKMADIDTLNAVHKKIASRKICRENAQKIKQIFFDAIPMVGTSSSLKMMRDLIWKREVVDTEKDMWLASLPFIQYPEKEMISAVRPLLEDKNVEGNTILMISSLVSGYCSVNPKCEDVAEVTEIMDILARMIGKCTSKGPYEKTLFALRAIGNIGHSKSIVPRLTQCFTRKEIPVQVRLAAIDAFRRIPCDVMRVDLLDLFNDINEDAELRINAYLALMKCPHKNIVMRIKEALRTEKTNQVGSFVWTHLTNLKQTSDPHMQELRMLLEDQELKTVFNKDNRKFSRNYENSFFIDELNAGGKAESNVIFSPKSFVPRSANLNLTIDLFGSAINLFEFGTRMEGVETLLERYFGNSGYFNNKKDQKAAPQKSQMNPFDDKYKVDIDALKGFAFMRMFGNELGFWQFENPNFNFFKNFDIKKWVKDEKITVHKNMALMDTQLIIPTMIGLPLNLTIAATASIDLEASGKMNLASLKNIEIAGHIKPSGAVKVASQITVDAFATKAGLRINSLAHSSTEAKMSFRMKNSKVIESRFELPKKKMEIIGFKTDFYIVKGGIVKEQRMISDNLVSKSKCTGEGFNKVTGLKLCTELRFANASMKHNAPYFPLTGPVVMKIDMINHDALEGFLMTTHVSEATQSGFKIDTPNSKVNRKISLDININNREQEIVFDSPWKKVSFNGKFVETRAVKLVSGEVAIDHKNKKIDKYSASIQLQYAVLKGTIKWTPKFVIMTPSKKMMIDGMITRTAKQIEADITADGFYKEKLTFKLIAVTTKKEYSCSTTLHVGAKEYHLKTKIGMTAKGKSVIYTPELLFRAGGQELVKFDSSFLYNPNAKIIVAVKLDKVFSKIVSLNLKIMTTNNKKKIKQNVIFNVKAPKVMIDVKGNVELKESRIASRVTTTYKIGTYEDKLTISSKLLDESTKKMALYSGDLNVDSKNNQKNNFILSGLIGKGGDNVKTSMDLEIGNPKKNPDKFNFAAVLNYNLKPTEKIISYTMSFKRPSKNVDVGLKINHENRLNPNKVKSEVEITYGPGKTDAAQLEFLMIDLVNFNALFAVKHHGKELFHLEDHLSSMKPNTYHNNLKIVIPNGKKVVLETHFEKKADKSVHMRNTLLLPNNGAVRVNGNWNIGNEKGDLHFEINATPNTIRTEALNPKVTLNYELNMKNKKIELFKFQFAGAISPSKAINIDYSLLMPTNTVTQEVLITSSFHSLKRFETKYTNKQFPRMYQETFVMKINDYFTYEEAYNLKYEDEEFGFDYKLKQIVSGHPTDIHIKCHSTDKKTTGMLKYNDLHDSMLLEMALDNKPATLDVKLTANIAFPKNKFAFDMKSTTTFQKDDITINSNGEMKLQHPKTNLDLTYFARADTNRITFDTNFLNPTSKHRSGKLSIDIAMDDAKTSLNCKVDIDYNGKPLYSLNSGYKNTDMTHNFQLAFLLPNGERISTVFNLGLAGHKTIKAEIKLPQNLGSFELNLDGLINCVPTACDCELLLTTNTPALRNLAFNLKHNKMALIDLDVKFDGIIKNLELKAKIEGEHWDKKTVMAALKINNNNMFTLDGNYLIESPRKFNAMLNVISKLGRTTEKFEVKVLRDAINRNHKKTEVLGILDFLNKKYTLTLNGKDDKEFTGKVTTPTNTFETKIIVNKIEWNNFDIIITLSKDNTKYHLTILNHHFQEIKFSAALPMYEKFDIVYNGGINDQKTGNFKLKVSYGEQFVECSSTLNMGNQFDLKSNVEFKIMQKGANPKVHAGNAEFKIVHHMDSLFQKINANVGYGKNKYTFSSVVKNTGKVSVNIRVKTNVKLSATLKAQIKPDFSTADLSLNFDTKWTGAKKLTYSHSVQKGKSIKIDADLGDGKGKQSDHTLSAMVPLRNPYALIIEVSTDKMTKKYKFDGLWSMDRNLIGKGHLRIEAPFAFMAGKPLELSFNRDTSKFVSEGSFREMEYRTIMESVTSRVLIKATLNWNKMDKASHFDLEMKFRESSDDILINREFDIKLIHPVRTVAFSVKHVENSKMTDVAIQFSGDVAKEQNIGLSFGRTHGAGYVQLSLPERDYKLSGRVENQSGKQVFHGCFFWDFEKDPTKKIDLIVTSTIRNTNAVFDVVLKFPSQTKGLRLKTDISWLRGDALLKSKTEFSFNQDPKNVLTAQTELLKDDNNKYTLTMALNHPKSNLDMSATIRVFELKNKLTVSIDMKNGKKNLNVVAYLDKKHHEISMKMMKTGFTAEVVAHYVKEKDYEVTIKMVEGSKKPMEVYFILSPSRKNMKLKVNYDESMPEKSFNLEGSLMTNKMVMVEAFRVGEKNKMTTDTRMDFTMDDYNVLHGKIVWRPAMVYELNQFIHMESMKTLHTMRTLMMTIYGNIVAEGTVAINGLRREFAPEIREIEVYMTKEFNIVAAETREMLRTLGEMYDRNYLFVNSIAKWIGSAVHSLSRDVEQKFMYLGQRIRAALMNHYRVLLYKMEELKMKINHIYQESYRKLAYDFEQAKLYVLRKVSVLNEKWIAVRNEYLRKLNELNRRTYQAVFDHKYTKAIILALNQRWEELVDFMRQHQMMKPVSDLISYVRMHMKDIMYARDQLVHKLKNHPTVHELYSIANDFYQQLVWAYKFWKVEETVRNLDDIVKNYITITANGIREQIFSMNQIELIAFDLQRGHIEFTFPLVMPKVILQNRRKAAKFMRMVKTTINRFHEWHPEYNYTMADLYYSMKPSSNPIDWIPPFKAQASIYRDQHITTFDGVHIDFKGACSYLLAKDFAGQRFAAIAKFAKYGKDQKIDSVLFHIPGETIELFRGYMVHAGGQRVDLPLKTQSVSVNRRGEKLEIRSTEGYTLVFNPVRGEVSMEISGWYFGKVAGLFGTYNNEKYDEMTMSEQRRTTDVSEFAMSWSTKGCRSRQNFAQIERNLNKCEGLFKGDYSPFRNCFRVVEPDSFYHDCNTDHTPRLNECEVAQFYIERCADKGVPLTMPERCTMCKTPKGEMLYAGQEMMFSEKSRKDEMAKGADIVFVVEQRSCNKHIVTDLNRIIQGLEQTLRTERITNNRYGLVAFGGENILSEYSLTMRSELMASAGLIMDEVKRMEFHDSYSMVDPLKAISLAAKYPFRMASRKAIVLVTCDMFCREKSVSYAKVLSQLKQHDIALHLLQKLYFQISGNKSPKTTDLYGIDSRQVFTKMDHAAKDTDYKLPGGNCAELSLASNGSIFDATKMSLGDVPMFVRRFTQRIADSVEKVSCQVCHCAINEMGMSQTICSRCPSIIPKSSPLYLPGNLFQGNFQINENLKEQLNKYWQRFQKKDLKSQGKADKAAKPASKKSRKGRSKRRRSAHL